jgi:hypothetical protein
MENFDWIGFTFYFLIGWAISKAIAVYLESRNRQLETQIQDLQNRIDNRIINVKIEKHGEIFYLFDKKNDTFVAQGINMEELQKHVDARFKNKKVVIANQEEMAATGLK